MLRILEKVDPLQVKCNIFLCSLIRISNSLPISLTNNHSHPLKELPFSIWLRELILAVIDIFIQMASSYLAHDKIYSRLYEHCYQQACLYDNILNRYDQRMIVVGLIPAISQRSLKVAHQHT